MDKNCSIVFVIFDVIHPTEVYKILLKIILLVKKAMLFCGRVGGVRQRFCIKWIKIPFLTCHLTCCSQSDPHITRGITVMCHVTCSQLNLHITRAITVMCHVTSCSQSDLHITRDITVKCHVTSCSQSDLHITRDITVMWHATSCSLSGPYYWRYNRYLTCDLL